MNAWLKKTIVPKVAFGLIQLLSATLRLRLEDPHGVLKKLPPGPVIFSFWHNRLLLMPKFYNFFYPGRRGAALISQSRDGEVIANITSEFGVQSIRGSSSKQAVVAFRELIRAVEEDKLDIIITPDGPRGPRYQAHLGVLQLSQRTGCPIIGATYHLSRKWEMKSWDRFQIPQPFARCYLIVDEPFVVPSSAEDLSPFLDRLTRAMNRHSE